MNKNFKLRLLTGISALTLLTVAHVQDANASIDFKAFNSNTSNIYSTMNIMGGWNEVLTISRQGISGKSIRKLRAMQSTLFTVEQEWQSQNTALTKLSPAERLAVYNSPSYQEAYTQYLYMTKYVKPLTAKLISGQHLSATEAKQFADPFAINAIKNTEKATTVAQFVNQQIINLGVISPPVAVTPTPVAPPVTVAPTPVTSTTVAIAPKVTTVSSNGAQFIEAATNHIDGPATQTIQEGSPVSNQTYADSYKDVDNGNGSITRTTTRITTITSTTPQTKITMATRTWTDKIYMNVTTTTTTTPQTQTTYSDGRVVVSAGTATATTNTVKTFVSESIRTAVIETNRIIENMVSVTSDAPGVVTNTQSISKVVSNTTQLTPVVETSKQHKEKYTVPSHQDSAVQSVAQDGTPVKNSNSADNIQITKNTNGTTTTNTYKITTTVTTTPRTITESYIRTYTDTVKQDVVTTTRTTPVTKISYTDGTSITQKGATVESQSTETVTISSATRFENIAKATRTENIVSTESNTPGVLVASHTTPMATVPPDNSTVKDPNMGTPTAGHNTDQTFYNTNEYKASKAHETVKADMAYSRGWTGKGVTIAVADSGYNPNNPDTNSNVVASRDYTNSGIVDTNGHGGHVLTTIVGKKNDFGSHGIAYDANAIVVKIASGKSVNLNNAAHGLAWAAEQGAVVGNISANSQYDKTFRNSLVGVGNGDYISKDSRYNYAAGKYYNVQDPALWKAATDKGMVVVNSAGNQGLPVSANPGYFATVTDKDGNLVLGGKMLIVGALDTNKEIAWYSNKAGHICQQYNIATNACSDKYKVSDFYILAPGWTATTKSDGDVDTMQGTSMAAPIVTGGVAIVSQMWPYMKGENIVKLLTTTADKNLPGYDKGTHGAGLLDLDKATQPIGAVGIPTSGRTTSAAKTTNLTSTGGSGTALSALAKSGTLSNVMVVDEFQRDFYINLSQGITVKDKRKISEVNVQQSGSSYLPFQHSIGSFEQGGEWHITDDLKFGFSNSKDVKGDYTTHVAKDWKVDDSLQVRTTMGTVGEKQTWLGNASSGALSVGKNNKTYFTQIGLEYVKEKDTWSIDLGRGLTTVNTTNDSMIKKVNTLQSQSLKLGYERHMDDYQKWGVTVAMPNYVSRGSATVQLPHATTAEGDIIYENVKANLKTRTPERNLGLYYTASGETDLDWNIRFSTELRQNIAGETGKKGVEVGLQFEKKF